MQDVNQAANDPICCTKKARITLQHMNSVSAVSCLDPFTSDSEALGAKLITQTTRNTPRSSDKRQNSRSKAALTHRSMRIYAQKAIGTICEVFVRHALQPQQGRAVTKHVEMCPRQLAHGAHYWQHLVTSVGGLKPGRGLTIQGMTRQRETGLSLLPGSPLQSQLLQLWKLIGLQSDDIFE